MYGVHITFDNGHEPVTRFHMTRRQYCDEMLKWQIDYDLQIERTDEYSTGDVLIFYNAHERNMQRALKNMERAKSRAKYYERTNGRNGEGTRARSRAEG